MPEEPIFQRRVEEVFCHLHILQRQIFKQFFVETPPYEMFEKPHDTTEEKSLQETIGRGIKINQIVPNVWEGF